MPKTDAAAAPADLAEPDERTPVTVRLLPLHLEYLERRAAAHGETPERHLETILRSFRKDDPHRHGRDTAPRGLGAPAGTSPR